MATKNYYNVGAAGSGWGVWDATGKKIASYTCFSIGRYYALRYLYHLNGWDWNRSKYVRANPSLKDMQPWDGKF